MSKVLLDGTAAIAKATVAAGCRFFAGYPMSPFTELLEHLSRTLPASGGVCMNAESEIEAVNMALGAASTGARSATGSCGQGLALMQEAIAEAAFTELPLVVFNLARNQQDYFQATRGGGWGDYRTLTLAPKGVPEAVEHTQLLFDLADRYRAPVILLADHLVAQAQVGVDVQPRELGPLPDKPWALDGSRGGTGRSRLIWSFAMGKVGNPGPGPDRHFREVAEKFNDMAATEARGEQWGTEDAETVVVSFGSAAPYVEWVVDELRADGERIGWFRPVTLWPFPHAQLEAATARAARVLVFELNAGQMLDDVRLSVRDRSTVRFIGGVSSHEHGLRVGTLMELDPIRERVLAAHRGET